MKYIFFTFDGSGLSIAYHLLEEGHEVLVGQVMSKKNTLTKEEQKSDGEESAMEKKRRLLLYKNIVEKIPADVLIKRMKQIENPQDYFVLFDYNNMFYYADQIRDMGFKGHFPTQEDAEFETDRDKAKEFVREYYPEVEIVPKKEFNTVASAKRFLRDTERIWVIKARGDTGPTFIPQTDDVELAGWQTIETLEAFRKDYEEAGFILEEKIASVIEVTPEKIYYDGVPLALTINFENKTIGSGNLSLQTGCSADLVFPVSFDNRINDIAFPAIVDELAKNHKGLFIWDASLLIDQHTGKIYFGEFCSNRLGFNSSFTEFGQLPSVNHFFESLVNHKNPFTLGTVGASLSFFNLSRDPLERHVLSGASIGYPDEMQSNVWLYDVFRKNEHDRIRIAGYDWAIGAVTGFGKTVDEAVNNLYSNVEEFSMGGVYYRPKSDYLSMDYPTSILNRLRYTVQRKLFEIPFKGVY